MFGFIRSKKARFQFYYGLTILMALFLLLGVVFVLKGKNYISFVYSLVMPFLVLINLLVLVYWIFKRSKWLLLPFIALIIFYCFFDSFYQLNLKTEEDIGESVSILTFNVRGFNKQKEIDRDNIDDELVDFIKQKNTDILLFQEFSFFKLKDFDEYPYYFLGYREEVTKSLQVILSKFPIMDKGYIDFSNTFNNAMFADIKVKDDIIRVYNVHLQSFWVKLEGDKGYYSRYSSPFKTISLAQKMRIEQTQMILDHAKNFNGPIIISGDFNSTQFSSTYKSLKEGKKDTFVEAGLGFGTTFELIKYPLRLDYILVDDSFDVVSHQNFDLNLSDHEPVMAELVLNE